LFVAMHYDQVKICKFLIERGANLNALTSKGRTVLDAAIKAGEKNDYKKNIAKILFKAKANVSDEDMPEWLKEKITTIKQ